jgi:hypothetical protein
VEFHHEKPGSLSNAAQKNKEARFFAALKLASWTKNSQEVKYHLGAPGRCPTGLQSHEVFTVGVSRHALEVNASQIQSDKF